MKNSLMYNCIFFAIVLVGCSESRKIDELRYQEVKIQLLELDSVCQDFYKSLDEYRNLPGFFTKFIDVPLNWEDRNNSGRVRLFIYGILNRNNLIPPIIFLNGGPVASSHSSFYAMIDKITTNKLDFVFFDQRGTGCSSPVPSRYRSDFFRQLQYFRSNDIVYDIEVIRKVILGTEQPVKIFGQSFGGYLAFRYLARFPNYVDSMHVHGFSFMANQREWYKNRFLSQKRVSDEFFHRFPQASRAFDRLQGLIEPNICFTNGNNMNYCGDKILQLIVSLLGRFEQWNVLEKRVVGLLNEDGTLNHENLSLWVKRYAASSDNIDLLKLLINTTEVHASDRRLDVAEECRDFREYLIINGESYDDWKVSECKLISEQNFPEALNDYINAVSARPFGWGELYHSLKDSAVEVFLYSSEFDPYVPPLSFVEMENLFEGYENLNYIELENSGHDGFLEALEVWDRLGEK